MIVIFILFISFIYYCYRFSRLNSPPILRYPIFGSIETALMHTDYIQNSQINNFSAVYKGLPIEMTSTEMAFFFFMYPDNLYVDKQGSSPIISVGLNQLDLRYDAYHNFLIINVQIFTKSLERQEFVIRNALQIQKWNMILINVNSRHIDIYIDGKIIESFYLKNVPILRENTFYFLNYKEKDKKFYGMLSCARFFNFSLNNKDAINLYNKFKNQMKSMNLFWYIFLPQKFNPILFT